MLKVKIKELDLSPRHCHACGGDLTRDLDKGTERCTTKGCAIRNINFTIPFIEEEGKEEKQNAENETK